MKIWMVSDRVQLEVSDIDIRSDVMDATKALKGA